MNRTFTGYAREDGWDERNAARRWKWDGELVTFEYALSQVNNGVPIDEIPRVMVAQSMYEPPYPFATEVLIEVTEGKFKGAIVPGVLIDAGAFGASHFDIYTESVRSARDLTSHSGIIHILGD